MHIDKHVSLIDIIPKKPAAVGNRRICALAIDKKSPVIQNLLRFEREKPEDFKKLRRILTLLSEDSVIVGKHVKRGKGSRTDILEVRAGHIRVFYFYDANGNDMVICTNTYWKAKSSNQEQDKAFAIAQR